MLCFCRGILEKILSGVVPAVQNIMNLDTQCTTGHPMVLKVENDSHYCVYSHIETKTLGPALTDAYHSAYPLFSQHMRVTRENLMRTSSLLQQQEWPYCQVFPKCRQENNSHRCDLAKTYLESINNVPPMYVRSKLFGIPLIILEVEGSKDTLGRMEQQAKAMHEVTSLLAVVPECFLVFVFKAHIELWQAKQNPVKSAVEILCEEIHLNSVQRSLSDSLDYFLDRLIEMLVKQMARSMVIADAVIPFLRVKHQCKATRHTWVHNQGLCCPDCYTLDTLRSASTLKAGFPNTAFYWEDGHVAGSMPPSPPTTNCFAKYLKISW